MANNNCDNCAYWVKMGAGQDRYCSYLFKTDKIRPCPPGEGCTVKITRKVNRRKKKEVKV